MAGDWIKMRTDLDTDPAVLGIAADLDIPETQVVGCLHKLWVWFTNHTTDGCAPSVTVVALDRITGVSGFATALVEHGWLVLGDSESVANEPDFRGCIIPNFDRHMSQGAKNRALAAIRMSKSREKKALRTERNTSATRPQPEKRREEIAKTTSLLATNAGEPASSPGPLLRWSSDSGWDGIDDEARRARWAKAYPAVDLDAAFARMDSWLRANPGRVPRSAWARFVNRWLGGDQRDSAKPATQGRFDEAVDRSAFERAVAKAASGELTSG